MNRREFLASGIAGLAAAPLAAPFARATRPPLDARFTYDVSAFMHTDPALRLYEETGAFPTGLQAPQCLAVDGDAILVGGDRALKVFDLAGRLRRTRELPAPPHAVAAGPLVAFRDRFQQFGDGGLASGSFGDRAHLTAIARTGDTVYVADAGNRQVLRCDPSGRILSRLEGFAVPSPYFDLHIGPDGLLWVVNPGKHRVEGYTLDGDLEFSWGASGMSIETFCGCCNPVYCARLPDGRFVTSEKGLNRIKIHEGRGTFLGVVAGVEDLVPDLELARKACANCRIGFGFPVAADAAGRVLALDPARKEIRIFTAKTP